MSVPVGSKLGYFCQRLKRAIAVLFSWCIGSVPAHLELCTEDGPIAQEHQIPFASIWVVIS